MNTVGESYRPDIDGLRCLAVVPVILFHAGVPGFSGGFVGVDVFFVISGFLITSILRTEMVTGDFSLVRFYERRARRILPALFAVIFACLATGWIVSLPSALTDLAASAVAAGVFVSNIHFLFALDYFADAAEFHPLLHTWSLAVEEQFYIVFPLVLTIAIGNVRIMRATVSAILIASLAASVIMVDQTPSAAFYTLPSRAWELMLGAALALRMVPAVAGFVARAIAMVGALLILLPVVIYTRETAFPGWTAIPPCIGAAMLIHAGNGTEVGRILSLRPFVFAGLTSYSLYLWHWPILAFMRQMQGSVELGAGQIVIALALTIVLAWTSWRYIERPFRTRSVSRRSVFAASGSALIATIIAGAAAIAASGFPSRYDDRLASILAGENDKVQYDETCTMRFCVIGSPDAEPTFLLWGDSHAGAFIPAVDVAAKAVGKTGISSWHSACAPLKGVRRTDRTQKWQSCVDFNSATLKMLAEHPEISTVILSARWAVAATGERDVGQFAPLARLDGIEETDNASIFRYGLDETLRELAALDKAVIILGGVPEIGRKVPEMLAASLTNGTEISSPDIDAFYARNAIANHILDEVVGQHGGHIVEIAPILCKPQCIVADGDRPLYTDNNHLSVYAGRNIVGPALAASLWND